MITVKNNEELVRMREACRISAGALKAAADAVRPGVTTYEIDKAAFRYIEEHGAVPSFLGYGGFPATCCLSVNDEVIHGIPSHERVVKEGDIVSIDVGAIYQGFHGDNAATVPVGSISKETEQLLSVTEKSLYEGIKMVRPGNRIGDISHAVQTVVEAAGFSVVRDFVGHGVGAELHEDPQIPNYGRAGRGPRLAPGMTLAIEPMVNVGDWQVWVTDNDWTVRTCDGSMAAHFEHTVLVTETGFEILTVL